MRKNIHIYERMLRVIVGAGLLVVAFSNPKNLWMCFGFLPLVTGLFGWCPYYEFLNSSKRYKEIGRKER